MGGPRASDDQFEIRGFESRRVHRDLHYEYYLVIFIFYLLPPPWYAVGLSLRGFFHATQIDERKAREPGLSELSATFNENRRSEGICSTLCAIKYLCAIKIKAGTYGR